MRNRQLVNQNPVRPHRHPLLKERKLSRPSLPVTVRSSEAMEPSQWSISIHLCQINTPSSRASTRESHHSLRRKHLLPPLCHSQPQGSPPFARHPYLAHVTALGGKFVPWSTMIQRLPTRTYFMAVSSKTMVTTVFTLSWKDP